jgi:hypothetical protein
VSKVQTEPRETGENVGSDGRMFVANDFPCGRDRSEVGLVQRHGRLAAALRVAIGGAVPQSPSAADTLANSAPLGFRRTRVEDDVEDELTAVDNHGEGDYHRPHHALVVEAGVQLLRLQRRLERRHVAQRTSGLKQPPRE